MYVHYAVVENDQLVEYPVNPRVFLALQNCYNVPEYWEGGVLDGKTYVYCHNFEPPSIYTKNIVEVTPLKNPENGLWYRQYEYVDASPEEIEQRTALEAERARNTIRVSLEQFDAMQTILDELEPEKWDVVRAKLRDVPNQPGFPWNIEWPQTPDAEIVVAIGVERL